MRSYRLPSLGLALATIYSMTLTRAMSQLRAIDRNPVCDFQDVLDAGKPMFFPQSNGVSFGLSLPKRSFLVGERIPAAIWISNDSDREYTTSTCGMFTTWDAGVWNQSGERLLNDAERRNIPLGTCAANSGVSIKAHSCRRVNERLLNRNFELPAGQYRLGELPGPRITLESKHDPAPMPEANASLLFNVSEVTSAEVPVRVEPARPHPERTTESTQLPQVFGRVLRSDTGSPIPGVEVHIGNGSPGGCCHPAVTDANGDYRFDGLADSFYTATAFADGFVTGDYHCAPGPKGVCKDRAQHITAASHLEMDFRLLPEALIRGKVIAPDGRSAGGGLIVTAVPVSLIDEAHRGVYSTWAQATTRSDGTFTLAKLPPASYLIRARQMMGGRVVPPPSEPRYHEAWYGNTRTPAGALPVTLKEAELHDNLRITVTPEIRYNIILWLSGPDGVAPPREYIIEIPDSNTTAIKQPDGSYLIPNVSPGHYSLQIFAAGLPQGVPWAHETEVDVGAADTTVHLNITAK